MQLVTRLPTEQTKGHISSDIGLDTMTTNVLRAKTVTFQALMFQTLAQWARGWL